MESLPGFTLTQAGKSPNTERQVGPTPTELESFKELIQFDHVYFKPQPQGKMDLNGQIKPVSEVMSKLSGNSFGNVNIIITSDAKDIRSDEENIQLENILNVNSESEDIHDDNDTLNLVDISSDSLTDVNFDLLEDLENILMAESEGPSCPESNILQAQNINNGSEMLSSLRMGIKRKAAEAEIEAICDTLKAEITSPSNIVTVSVDSDFGSDGVPSPYSAGSTYSAQDLASPENMEDVASPLADTTWEESFTELFPDLM